MSILQTLFGVQQAVAAGDVMGALKAAMAGVNGALPDFQASQADIQGVASQVLPYLDSADNNVKVKAGAVQIEAAGLAQNYAAVYASASATMSQANQTIADMNSDPVWRQVLGLDTGVPADWNSFGYEVRKKVEDMVGAVSATIQDLTTDVKQFQSHLAQVRTLKADMADLVNLSQGRGLAAFESRLTGGLSSIGSGAASMLKGPLMVAAGVAVAIMLLPQLMGGAAAGARRALYANPRRRRHYRRRHG